MRKLAIKSTLAVALASLLASSAFAQDTAPAEGAPPAEAAPASAPAATAAATGATTAGEAPSLNGFSALLLLQDFFYGYYGIGVGGRYTIPIGIPSLLTNATHGKIRDSWGLEPGLDFVHIGGRDYGVYSYSYNVLTPTVGMMWFVWLTDEFAVYPKVEGGWQFGFSSSNSCSGCSTSGIYTEGSAGLLYKLSGLTLRAEVGNYGVKGGLAFFF